jgi:D-lactate dehydrogenase
MCCGVAYNTYHTMLRLRLMLVDGTVLDTGEPASIAAFRQSHAGLLQALADLHHEIMADAELVALIRRKYRIKNTVGYSINALIDFHDPIDILIHLIVGSEGTLGFVSEVTYRTIDEHPHKASDLVIFPDPYSCARAISRLANGGVQTTTGVTAAEYMERRALATVEHVPVIKPYLPYLGENSPGVLIDVSAPDLATLAAEIAKAEAICNEEGATRVAFTVDDAKSEALWDVRKGFFASGGAARPKGTTFMTEDVAAPVDRLADFVLDLRALLDELGYPDAVIIGHALAGNLHFLMSGNFTDPAEVERFDVFNKALAELVSIRYGGSLKAEHGTGRAIAPFVEAEWGEKAYAIMQRIKPLFDPEGLLNPGVLITPDKNAHINDLKLMPLADPIVDMCIECGFCEPACPATHLTLSPRQRIAVTRERARLRQTGEDPARLATLERDFQYAGLNTCAAGNVCASRCPVGIETGTMVLGERARRRTDADRKLAHWVGGHTRAVETTMKLAVGAQALSRTIIGNGATDALATVARKVTGGRVPRVSRALQPGPGAPKPIAPPNLRNDPATAVPVSTATMPDRRVVYFPSCATRMFGAPTRENGLLPTPDATIELLRRAGFDPVVPENLGGACCGQPFLSKGFPEEAARVGGALNTKLSEASDHGACPVVTDASTCAKHLREHPGDAPVLDSAEFLLAEVLPKLTITAKIPVLAVHHNCSAQRLKEQGAINALAAAMAEQVIVLQSFACCGYAGDKGLFVPELNEWATRFARGEVPADCKLGISTVSTCASGLTDRIGIPFVSIASLLESVSQPKS